MNSVGVVGAGTMGLGIAQVCATAGCEVKLYDVSAGQLVKAVQAIRASAEEAVSRKKLTPAEADRMVSLITTTADRDSLKTELIIEAALEQLEVKQELFRHLELINEGKAILATNTSSLSVSRIAAELKDPSRMLGFHFFNPADRMKLVEVVAAEQTNPVLIEEMVTFARRLGKIPVRTKDSPGFIVNRVARPFYTESLKLAEESAAGLPGIDKLIRSAGFRMGPFELMDLIGLDVNLAVTRSVFEGFGKASRFKPSFLQARLVEEGKLGRKSGQGFYNYANRK